MNLSFIGALIFSLVFFGVWSLKDAANSTAPGAIKPLLIGLLFILLAFVVTKVL